MRSFKKTVRKYEEESKMKNIITKIKNAQEGINSRLSETDE